MNQLTSIKKENRQGRGDVTQQSGLPVPIEKLKKIFQIVYFSCTAGRNMKNFNNKK